MCARIAVSSTFSNTFRETLSKTGKCEIIKPKVCGNSAYSGQEKALSRCAPKARDDTHKKGARHRKLSDKERQRNRSKSKVRCKVERMLFVMKRQFHFTKVRDKGLDKNTNHVFASGALINLVMARQHLLSADIMMVASATSE